MSYSHYQIFQIITDSAFLLDFRREAREEVEKNFVLLHSSTIISSAIIVLKHKFVSVRLI